MDFWKGKTVFITGGSSGIGKACAELALNHGAKVMIVGRRQQLLDEAKEEIEQKGFTVETLALDVADEKAVNACVETVVGIMGPIDVVINNAGIANCGYIENETSDNYRQMMDINYLGSVWVTRAFLPQMMERKSGNIGFTSSVLGLMGLFGYSAYAASKYAMTGYADCLRMDILRYGIGVHVCFPPDTDTPQHHEEMKMMPAETASVAGNIKCKKAEDVAADFLWGIAKGKYQIIPSIGNKVTMAAVRHMPGISRFFIDRDIRSTWSKKGPTEEVEGDDDTGGYFGCPQRAKPSTHNVSSDTQPAVQED